MRIAAAFAVAAGLAACGPGDQAALVQQNSAQCNGGSYPEQRIAACTAVVENSSVAPAQRAAALVQRGMLRAELGQQARAMADFGRAIRLDATNSDAYSERGMVHQQRGAFDMAMRDYEAALAVDPTNSVAAYRREQAMAGRVDAVQQQIARLDEILGRDARNAGALNDRCWIRAINDEDLNLALGDCNASLRVAPRSAAALDSRGLVNLKRGDYQAALADYEAALALEPNRGHFMYGRGLARERLGQTAEGSADLVAAEAAEPGVAQAYAGYGYIPPVTPAVATLDERPSPPAKP
jgi:tetratricopeptide (TPR) repeat protein